MYFPANLLASTVLNKQNPTQQNQETQKWPKLTSKIQKKC